MRGGVRIVPGNLLWRELSGAIISYGGNLTTLVGDIGKRLGVRSPVRTSRRRLRASARTM
jgi:hypothetical protein